MWVWSFPPTKDALGLCSTLSACQSSAPDRTYLTALSTPLTTTVGKNESFLMCTTFIGYTFLSMWAISIKDVGIYILYFIFPGGPGSLSLFPMLLWQRLHVSSGNSLAPAPLACGPSTMVNIIIHSVYLVHAILWKAIALKSTVCLYAKTFFSEKENVILIFMFCFSVYWACLPSLLLWERTLFSHRLQVRISVLLNQINLMSFL